MKSKKGGGPGDLMTIIFSILLYALILVVFSVLMFSKSCTSTTSEENTIFSSKSQITELDNLLRGYLRTKVEIDGKDSDIAELIGMRMANSKYKNLLEEETEKALLKTSVPCPAIRIFANDSTGAEVEFLRVVSDCAKPYRGDLDSAPVGQGTIYSSVQTIPLPKSIGGTAKVKVTSRSLI